MKHLLHDAAHAVYLSAFSASLIGLFVVLSPYSVSAAESSAPNILFILDASGSMREKVENREKIVVAKEVMTNLINELPSEVNVGLEVFGHRKKGACDDIETMVPVSPLNKDSLVNKIQSITAKGETPISTALRIAGEQLRAKEQETSIVLVSDGKEECKGDPCGTIKELKAQGLDVKVHVVGFDVGAEEKKQLSCIAEAGGGWYFTAKGAVQLKDALAQIKNVAVEKSPPHILASKPREEADKSVVVKIHALDDPLPIESGTTSKIILNKDEATYFKMSLPTGTVKIVLDMGRFDGKSGNLLSNLSILDQDGGTLQPNAIHFNEIDVDHRQVYQLSLDVPKQLIFKLTNDIDKAAFWLTVLKESDSVFVPFSGKVVPATMEEGQQQSGTLPHDGSAYYAVPMKKGEFKMIVDFTDASDRKTNLQGYAAVLNDDGGSQQSLIEMNEIDVSYRKVGSFSINEDKPVIIRLKNAGEPIKYMLKVAPKDK